MALLPSMLSASSWAALTLAAFALHYFACIGKNYLAARKMGIPIRVIPFDHTNVLWMLLDRKVVPVIKKLPGILDNNLTRYNWRTFELHDRYHSHHELGDVFVMVSPGRNWVYVGAPELATEVFRRKADFPQGVELVEILDVFGKNLGTVEGAKWKAQRKVIASCFAEPLYEVVWSQSRSLTRDMLTYWRGRGAAGLRTSADDLRTLSLLILSGAGFGRYVPFRGREEPEPELGATGRQGSHFSSEYKDALQDIMENCTFIMALGPKLLARLRPWLPAGWALARMSDTCARFQGYMTEMYEEEKRAAAAEESSSGPQKSGKRTLLRSLVRASQAESRAGAAPGLTESEMYGNMFMLNFAGHDTTAHTFTFALHFLATRPDVQAWVAEEARAVLEGEEWDYCRDFPRLRRALAVMLETLRIYSPVAVAKLTEAHVPLNVGGKTVVIPPKTMVVPTMASLQTDPRFWGDDSLEWRPARWIKEAGTPGDEVMIEPRPGTFMGWSQGLRDCPAKKFSKVEFVATIATLLRDAKVDPVPEDGESLDQARERVKDLIRDDTGAILLYQILHPERVALAWSER